jgi:hypothetical protein
MVVSIYVDGFYPVPLWKVVSGLFDWSAQERTTAEKASA